MKRLSALLGTIAALAAVAALTLLSSPADAAAPAFAIISEPALLGFGLGGLVVNAANLARATTGFSTLFNDGLGMAPPQWQRVAMRVPSSTSKEEYGWLGQVPGLREWVGDRVVHGLAAHKYTIANKDFELTIAVQRNDIEDDALGVYSPLFTHMGYATAAHPNQLVFDLLKAGFATACYDGQYFFDTDHPVLDANGNVISVANTDGGAGTPWFLIDMNKPIKPIIFQERKAPVFTAMTKIDDENVFMRKEFRYGVDSRCNVGFGLWQMAWGSKQALNKANYAIAREALMGMKGDYGRPIGVMPKLLVVPPTLEGEALEIVNAERDAAGATNVYKGTAELLVVPWLA